MPKTETPVLDRLVVEQEQRERAQAAFVAGLVHATLMQGGWHVHEANAVEGRCTVGCAAVFGAGFVADISVSVRKVDEL